MSLGSRQRISTSCARILSVRPCFRAGWPSWGNSVLQHILHFSLTILTWCLCPCWEISGGQGRGTAELGNPASLGTRLGNGLKRWDGSVLLHRKCSMYLENVNHSLDNTYIFLIPLHSYRTTAGTRFVSLVLLVYFLLLDSVSAFEPFPLSSIKFRQPKPCSFGA